jgi:hypothetical protein
MLRKGKRLRPMDEKSVPVHDISTCRESVGYIISANRRPSTVLYGSLLAAKHLKLLALDLALSMRALR